jgi:primosomal protein N'
MSPRRAVQTPPLFPIADRIRSNADPRAAERTFQLLHQATGRAGRGERLGRALLQTWQPEHPVIAALDDTTSILAKSLSTFC